MLRGFFALLAGVLVFVSAVRSAPVGINLAYARDYIPAFYDGDAMKSARGWAPVERRYTAGDVELDAQGWPKGDAAIVIHASVPGVAGVYEVSWSGAAELGAPDGGRIERLPAQGGRERARWTVGGEQQVMSLSFTGTRGGVKEVRVTRPEPVDGRFVRRFLSMIEPFDTLRFMDWQLTNNSKQTRWSDRATPETAIWSRGGGVPLEVCVELVNQTRKNGWFCVPHLADDEYVREMARLLRDRMDPKLTVYVEYSNELWNFQFAQTNHYKKLASDWFDAEVAAGRRVEADRNPVMYPEMWRMIARRSNEVLRIVREEFGPGPRLVTVLGSQAAGAHLAKTMFAVEGTAEATDALAIAPYFAHDHGYAKKADATLAGGLDALFADMLAEVDGKNRKWIDANMKIAREAGVRMIAYEGGQHLVVASGDRERDRRLNALFAEANRDPRMAEVYLRHHRQWLDAGGELYVTYSLLSNYGTWGYWGLLESMDQKPEEVTKFRAILEAAKMGR